MALISILTATFQNAKYIDRMITSVLEQTFKDWELIIVDDGSTDETESIVSPYLSDNRIHYFVQNNQGQACARNFAFKRAKGQYIAVLDSDDYWAPSKLKLQMDYLSTHQNVGLVYTGKIDIDENGMKLSNQLFGVDLGDEPLDELISGNNPVTFSSILVDRRFLPGENFQEDTIKCSDDLITLLRIALLSGKFGFIAEPLTYYRVHKSSKTFVESIDCNKKGRMQTLDFFFKEFNIPYYILKKKSKFYAAVYLAIAQKCNTHRLSFLEVVKNVFLAITRDPKLTIKGFREIIRAIYLKIKSSTT